MKFNRLPTSVISLWTPVRRPCPFACVFHPGNSCTRWVPGSDVTNRGLSLLTIAGCRMGNSIPSIKNIFKRGEYKNVSYIYRLISLLLLRNLSMVSVCGGLWDLCCAPPQRYRTTSITTASDPTSACSVGHCRLQVSAFCSGVRNVTAIHNGIYS